MVMNIHEKCLWYYVNWRVGGANTIPVNVGGQIFESQTSGSKRNSWGKWGCEGGKCEGEERDLPLTLRVRY